MNRLALPIATVLWSLARPLDAAATLPLVLDASHRGQFDERGVWQLDREGGTLLSQCGLRLWTKGGYQTQANARPASPPTEGPAGRAFHGLLRAGQRQVEYWQSVTPIPNGLLVNYAVAAADLAEAEEVAACFDLPLATFAGASCSVGAGPPVALPAETSAQPRLIEQHATALRVQRDGLTVSCLRRPAGKVIVQDARHWGNPWFEVHLYARRAVGDPPGWRSVSFVLSFGKPPEGPVVAAVLPGSARVPCGETHEAEVLLWAPYENPFDPAQVAVTAEVMAPSGQLPQTAGFYAREYVRSQDQGAERLTPTGPGRWKVRLTPTVPGAHTCVVKAAAGGLTAASRPFTFTATPGDGQRFLAAPRAGGRYLERAAGDPVLLIGHNYGWPPAKEGTFAADAALARMAAAGINATRLWLCSWAVRLEGDRPDDFRLDDAWRLDRILQSARERGIYVQLCLDNFRDQGSADGAPHNPYLAHNGGPCQSAAQFFTHPAAREQYRRRLRYLVARYAPFTSLLAWELFSEVTSATDSPRDPAVLAWVQASGAHLKKLDPYGHPVTISLGLRAAWDELWRLPEIDLVQAHTYIPRPVGQPRAEALDAAALVLAEQDALEPFGKPTLIAEFGFLGTRDFNPLNEADKTGVHLHAALWASALGGCAGTAMHWWWDSYLADRDLYYHYAALASFLRGAPLPDARWSPVRSGAGSPLLVVGSNSRDAGLLWIRRRENTWYRRALEGRDPLALGRATVELAGLAEGRYRVEWWDTYNGAALGHAIVAASQGTLTLRPPERLPEVACKVRRLPD